MCFSSSNSGIGYECVKEFLKRGATVHMICRDQQRSQVAVNSLREETKVDDPQRLQLHILDIGSIASVKSFCQRFEESKFPCHILVNNAGCMVHEQKLTEEKLELNFATNTAGTFALTLGLLPAMRRSAADLSDDTVPRRPRIINVSSGGQYTQKLEVNELLPSGDFDATVAYAKHKRLQVAFFEKLGQLFDDQVDLDFGTPETIKCGVHADAANLPFISFFSMHPGWVDTPAVRSSMPDFHRRMEAKLRTPSQGADTIVWLAAGKSAQGLPSGGFYLDRTAQNKHLTLSGTRYSQQQLDDAWQRVRSIIDPIQASQSELERFNYLVFAQ